MAMVVPPWVTAVRAQPVPGNTPAKRLGIVPTAEEMQQFQREELKKKLEAFRKRLTTEFEQGRPKEAAKSIVYVDHKKTWFEAEDHCQSVHGTNLVSVASDAFNASLGETVKTMASNPQARVWIGLRRPAAYFVWSDTTPYFFQSMSYFMPWKTGEVKNCVSARSVRDHRGGAKFNWATEDCWEKRSFSCWKKGAKPTKFSVASRPVQAGKPESLIPDCPLLESQRVTAAAAKKWCAENSQCVGYRMHSAYAQIKMADKMSFIRFYQDGTECSQNRVDRTQQQNFVFIRKDK